MIGKKVAVIGGGISGLTTAYWLKNEGIDVRLFEKNSRVGGSIRTQMEDGFLIEHGPNSTLETTPLIDKLLDELNILGEKIYASKESDKRYILRNGNIYPLPMSPAAFLSTKLFSKSAKLRLLKEPFIRSKGNAYETIAEFTIRRLGEEFLDYAINPFVAGVFAGDPEMINVKTAFPRLYELEQKYGSLIKGALKSARQRKKSKEKSKQSAKTFSFKKGMQTLTDAIYMKILESISLNSSIIDIGLNNQPGSKHFALSVVKEGNSINEEFDAVVMSVPSYSASEIFGKLDSGLSGELREIYYPPVNVVYTGFNQSKLNHKLDGFGYLIPEQEKRKILGSLWSSSLFPGRAPEGYCALTSFVGGARSPKLTEMDDKDLVKVTLEELNSVLGITGEPDYVKIIRWGKAIPQYNNHYTDLYESIENFQNKFKGIFICNNFYKGIAVGDCIKNADSTVAGVIKFLNN